MDVRKGVQAEGIDAVKTLQRLEAAREKGWWLIPFPEVGMVTLCGLWGPEKTWEDDREFWTEE